jgi:quercetin dioxygenase-like cupin family protein
MDVDPAAVLEWRRSQHRASQHPGRTKMIVRACLVAGALVAGTMSAAAQSAPNPVTVAPAFRQAIPNIPGKTLAAVVVSYAPGAKSASHHHAGSAFISAYVLSGAVRSQVDDEPVKIYRAGESWFEQPGAHHKVSENASTTEPAQLLAIFVVDSDEKVLTTPDAK